ncbi:MAG TPA: acyl-CoA dehydrogenase family protein [Burkholderiales bacterium]|nr:acyl-CoA dehydrogenase family protein [Burkholderiales bacterium]
MPDTTFLDWPFFEPRHRALAEQLDDFAGASLAKIAHVAPGDEPALDRACREIVQRLGAEGFLNQCCLPEAGAAFDVRSLALSRETLARHAGLADFCFAMQGLGTGPISLFGTEAQRRKYLPAVMRGKSIAAFALSEPQAGSDVSAIATRATRSGSDYVLNGWKTWISNGGLADHYVVFARTSEGAASRGLSAFVVDAGIPGLHVRQRIALAAPHPLATLEFADCRIPESALVGEAGEGFKIAMATLDVFRTTVGAAALGFARRALDEALARVRTREAFGKPLAEFQLTQAKLADMALAIDASALLVYRAAWAKDVHRKRVTREAAMAKLHATESAQQVIDAALQLHGATGVVSGNAVESLYREIRALRIYEGTSEIQKLIIASALLKGD